jgi:hypothetical protein
MSLESRNVLHIADEATHFQAAAFLLSNTAEEVWRVFVRLWIRTYLGPPDFIRVDQGKNLMAELFVSSAIAEGIEVLEAPTECLTTMSHVERYHAPLRAAYQKIRSDFGFEPEEALELAVKCVNDTVGPDGLTPTLLVFGSIPRPARKVPADTQIQRVRAMDAARKAVTAEHARQKISFALRYIGPYGNERDDLKALERGDPVIIWRQKRNMWMPYTFTDLDGEMVTVQNSSGRSIFRTNVIRPAPPKRPLQLKSQPTPATASTQKPRARTHTCICTCNRYHSFSTR